MRLPNFRELSTWPKDTELRGDAEDLKVQDCSQILGPSNERESRVEETKDEN
jgi:hypothetical protein